MRLCALPILMAVAGVAQAQQRLDPFIELSRHLQRL